MFRVIYEYGHWTILKNGRFFGSADTKNEAWQMIQQEGES